MKKIITTLIVLLFTQMSFASSPFLQYEFGVEHKGEEFYINLKLFENADISVEVRPIEEAGAQVLVPNVLWSTLDPFLFNQLLASSKGLSKAEIKEINNQLVCQLYVPYSLQVNHLSLSTPYDEENGVFGEPLKVVKGPVGCWVKDKIFFVNEEKDQAANDIKIKLRNWFQQTSLLNQAVVIR